MLGVHVGSGAQHRVAAGDHDAGQARVLVGVVPELVGEHGDELLLGQGGEQGSTDEHPALRHAQTQETGVLGDTGVHRGEDPDLVRRAGADVGGQAADEVPERGLLRGRDEGAGHLVLRAALQRDQALDQREHHGHDEQRQLQADERPVDQCVGLQREQPADQREGEHVETDEQRDRDGSAERNTHE
nr:hypothetical protein [Lentzea indica]